MLGYAWTSYCLMPGFMSEVVLCLLWEAWVHSVFCYHINFDIQSCCSREDCRMGGILVSFNMTKNHCTWKSCLKVLAGLQQVSVHCKWINVLFWPEMVQYWASITCYFYRAPHHGVWFYGIPQSKQQSIHSCHFTLEWTVVHWITWGNHWSYDPVDWACPFNDAAPFLCWNDRSNTAKACPDHLAVWMLLGDLTCTWIFQSWPTLEEQSQLCHSIMVPLDGLCQWVWDGLPWIATDATNQSCSDMSLNCWPSSQKAFVLDHWGIRLWHVHPMAICLYSASLTKW